MMSLFVCSLMLGAGPCDLCVGDLDVDGDVDGEDLGMLLSQWGTDDLAADLNDDGIVDGADLTTQLAYWGNCGCMCGEWLDCTNPDELPNPGICDKLEAEYTLYRCPDINGDRVCDVYDSVILFHWWGTDLADPDLPQQATDCDLNDDGYVDVWDVSLWQLNVGRTW